MHIIKHSNALFHDHGPLISFLAESVSAEEAVIEQLVQSVGENDPNSVFQLAAEIRRIRLSSDSGELRTVTR